jgi:hypothetical protein
MLNFYLFKSSHNLKFYEKLNVKSKTKIQHKPLLAFTLPVPLRGKTPLPPEGGLRGQGQGQAFIKEPKLLKDSFSDFINSSFYYNFNSLISRAIERPCFFLNLIYPLNKSNLINRNFFWKLSPLASLEEANLSLRKALPNPFGVRAAYGPSPFLSPLSPPSEGKGGKRGKGNRSTAPSSLAKQLPSLPEGVADPLPVTPDPNPCPLRGLRAASSLPKGVTRKGSEEGGLRAAKESESLFTSIALYPEGVRATPSGGVKKGLVKAQKNKSMNIFQKTKYLYSFTNNFRSTRYFAETNYYSPFTGEIIFLSNQRKVNKNEKSGISLVSAKRNPSPYPNGASSLPLTITPLSSPPLWGGEEGGLRGEKASLSQPPKGAGEARFKTAKADFLKQELIPQKEYLPVTTFGYNCMFLTQADLISYYFEKCLGNTEEANSLTLALSPCPPYFSEGGRGLEQGLGQTPTPLLALYVTPPKGGGEEGVRATPPFPSALPLRGTRNPSLSRPLRILTPKGLGKGGEEGGLEGKKGVALRARRGRRGLRLPLRGKEDALGLTKANYYEITKTWTTSINFLKDKSSPTPSGLPKQPPSSSEGVVLRARGEGAALRFPLSSLPPFFTPFPQRSSPKPPKGARVRIRSDGHRELRDGEEPQTKEDKGSNKSEEIYFNLKISKLQAGVPIISCAFSKLNNLNAHKKSAEVSLCLSPLSPPSSPPLWRGDGKGVKKRVSRSPFFPYPFEVDEATPFVGKKSPEEVTPNQRSRSLLGDFVVYGDKISLTDTSTSLSLCSDDSLYFDRSGVRVADPSPGKGRVRRGAGGEEGGLGQVLGRGQKNKKNICSTCSVKISGQIIHYNDQKITLRRGQAIFISPKAILHKFDNDFIDAKTPVITLSYKRLKTGDIIEGIPKVEQFFEARSTKRGRIFRDSLPALLKGLFYRYKSKYPLDLAVRQSFYKIQQIIVDGVQRVYKAQGVTIADKHLEVIVKQMTSKVKIMDGAQTGFFPGEVVDLFFIEKVNGFLIKKITYEPLVLGITKASLEVESFLSASSFQQTTRVLSQAAIYRKKDFLKGLKENVILGNLIPAGTGYLVYLDDFLP